MIGLKINKIGAVLLSWLVMTAVLGFASQPSVPLERELEQEFYLNGNYPKVGEIFEVIYRIRIRPHLAAALLSNEFTVGFSFSCAVKTKKEKIGVVEVLTKLVEVADLKPGEWREFRGRFIIKKANAQVNLWAGTAYKGFQTGPFAGITMYLLDPETGQYGTKEQYEGNLPVEYRYDPIDGSFTCSPSQNPAPVEENRKIIKMIKTLEPALSDSEALLLHSDQFRVGHPKGIPIWNAATQTWNEEEIYDYYLKDGWFTALREGKREEWIGKEKQKVEDTWKERRFNFFRSGDNNRSIGHGSADRIWKEFDGTWKFKDHLYNKDEGLLADAIHKGIKQGRARIFACYWSGGLYYRILSSQYVTTDTGYFDIYMDIPSDASVCKAFAVVYPSGAGVDTALPMISVSDPNNTQPSYKKDPLDSTLYVNMNMDYQIFYANPLPVHFGIVYTDTYPADAQPQSGCINIYETYLQARTFMSPSPTIPLRVIWEPGFIGDTISDSTGVTAFRCDTVFVKGVQDLNTDEWDDDVLLHEFGHYLMDYYAEIPPDPDGSHYWFMNYPDRPYLAYPEAWATFFSGRARVGSEFDSLYVNTAKGIGMDTARLWVNIENPWMGDFPPELFAGGPVCEGGVAGVLWDIYDSYDETLYHSYPTPSFPDSFLADTLDLRFENIWNIFDDYDPPGEPTNCWTIYDFLDGWSTYAYGHEFGLLNICSHHRISPESISVVCNTEQVHRGDSLAVTITLTNNTQIRRIVQTWADVILPNGMPYSRNPVLGPQQVPLRSLQIIEHHQTHWIPASAPLGIYRYYVKIGNHSNPIFVMNQDYNTFEVVP